MSQRSNQQNINMRHSYEGGAMKAPDGIALRTDGILLRTEGILLRTDGILLRTDGIALRTAGAKARRTGKKNTGPWGQGMDPKGDYKFL